MLVPFLRVAFKRSLRPSAITDFWHEQTFVKSCKIRKNSGNSGRILCKIAKSTHSLVTSTRSKMGTFALFFRARDRAIRGSSVDIDYHTVVIVEEVRAACWDDCGGVAHGLDRPVEAETDRGHHRRSLPAAAV
jgi:hypothetical protein